MNVPTTIADWLSVYDGGETDASTLRRLSEVATPPAPVEADPAIWSAAATLEVVSWLSPRFPSALKKLKSPPAVLWALGDVELLTAPAASLCGSRNASDRGLRWARLVGESVAAANLTLVTGMARGVDAEAARAAIDAGGRCIGVLAEGAKAWAGRRWARDIEQGRLLIVSEFAPSTRWAVPRAMQRNSTICLLGGLMLVIEAGERGGTLAAGRTALRLGVPLYALRSQDPVPGNEILVREGARPLETTGQLTSVLREAPTGPLLAATSDAQEPVRQPALLR
ncbi:MAG: DNA-processing protein DprA [Chloroflexi bacterium]|nr:DNA-processing protein DprA [Chloroflexota bacterium]